MDDYTNLKFASLFHDIGKFYQRADNLGKSGHSYDGKYDKLNASDYGQNGAHAKWSADFTKDYFDDLVEDLVLYHHNPNKAYDKSLAKIVQKADQHSSKERIESDDKKDVLLTPLTSIFSRVSLNDKNNEDYFVPLIELDFFNKKGLHPHDVKDMEGWNLVPEYKKLWNNFVNEFNLLKNRDFESVLAVVKKYTATIPSAVYTSESDISLFDHLKTTTAIANCRYLYSKEEKLTQKDDLKVYKIINGDISGIQNFIYKVQSPDDAQSGMSKRLRGRSLYLTLLCESIADKIINELNLDSSNILFCGGGRFTIIAPNTKKADEIIAEIEYNVNKFFVEKFNAELYLALVSIEADGNDLGNFSGILQQINMLLSENKKHKFLNHLDSIFTVEEDISYEICPVCGNATKVNGEFCSECLSHESLGQAVTNARYVVKYNAKDRIPKSDFYIEFLEIGYKFEKSKNKVLELVNENKDTHFTIYKLNDTNFLDLVDDVSNENVSFNFKVLGNSIPNVNGKPLYFNHLAQISKGANKLGILKMDVDNLGLIFSKGFSNIGGASISRVSSLSFYLDLFFSGRINQVVNKFKVYPEDYGKKELFDEIEIEFENGDKEKVFKPNSDLPKEFRDLGTSTIHINYSGGDDLLVVGPYDDVIKFAYEFRTRFKKWTAQNDSINISAGISIVSPKFPIGKAALMADGELEKSKDYGRDKITLFGETLMWDSNGLEKGFDEIFEFANKLEDKTENKELSKGFVYSLLNIWQNNYKKSYISNEYEWNEDTRSRLSSRSFIPLFKYKLRLIKNKELRDDIDKNGIKYMPWIKTPVSWVSLRLR